VQFEELRYVCQQAALDLVRTQGRPLPPTVVLPGPERTALVTLPDLPATTRTGTPSSHSWRTTASPPTRSRAGGSSRRRTPAGEDVVVVVYGARRHAPRLTASRFAEDGDLEEFVPDQELDPTALPFLHPLQHAVDALPAVEDVFGRVDPKRGGGGLPIVP
jgi:hypothetical protein